MLIRVGASWCGPCRKLDAEIEKPSVQAELARWTLVYLDADKAEEEAAELNVSARARPANPHDAGRIGGRAGRLRFGRGPGELAEEAVRGRRGRGRRGAADRRRARRRGRGAAGAAVPAAEPGDSRGGDPAAGALSAEGPPGSGPRLRGRQPLAAAGRLGTLAAVAGAGRGARSLAAAKPDQGADRGLESLGGEVPAAGRARGQESSASRRWSRPAATSTACSRPTTATPRRSGIGWPVTARRCCRKSRRG